MDLYLQHFHLHPVEIQTRQKYMYKRKFPKTMIPPSINFSKHVDYKVFSNADLKKTQEFFNLERKRVQLMSKHEIKSFLNGI